MKPRKDTKLILCGLLALASISVGAAEDQAGQPADTRPPIVIGAATEAYLHLQQSGTAAGTLQPIRGEVASRSYQRYLETYTRPMPEPNQGVGSGTQPNTTSRTATR